MDWTNLKEEYIHDPPKKPEGNPRWYAAPGGKRIARVKREDGELREERFFTKVRGVNPSELTFTLQKMVEWLSPCHNIMDRSPAEQTCHKVYNFWMRARGVSLCRYFILKSTFVSTHCIRGHDVLSVQILDTRRFINSSKSIILQIN